MQYIRDKLIKDIMELYNKVDCSQALISHKSGVNHTQVHRIVNGFVKGAKYNENTKYSKVNVGTLHKVKNALLNIKKEKLEKLTA